MWLLFVMSKIKLSWGNGQTSSVRGNYVVSKAIFQSFKKNSILSFRNSRSILKLESQRLTLWVFDWMTWTENSTFHAKKISPYKEPYSGVFKSYSDVLKPYSIVFLQKNFYKCVHILGSRSPIVAFLSPIVTF